MLIVIGGLPGVGKTTLARELARRLGGFHLRIDAIEQSLCRADVLAGDVGAAGYGVAQAIAKTNITLGATIIADCVNPVAASREAWRRLAAAAAVPFLEIEVVCSDAEKHRCRVETRTADLEGHVLPTWEGVLRHKASFEPWPEAHKIDTARLRPDEAVACIVQEVEKSRARAGIQTSAE